MIPVDYITEWRAEAPWATSAQVEQDLILSRAVVSMFADPEVSRQLAETAIGKGYKAETIRKNMQF